MAKKRKNDDAELEEDLKENTSLENNSARPSSTIVGISRTIAACQRCRQKKTKCDQNFPSCSRCEKAGVECVGLDPATGRQVPRSYVIYLEDKISHLQSLLEQNGIDPDSSIGDEKQQFSPSKTQIKQEVVSPSKKITAMKDDSSIRSSLNLSVPSTNSNGLSFYIGDSSGISFAKLLFTAVKFHPTSINENNSITTRVPNKPVSKTIKTMLPSKSTAEFFLKSYFEQSNTQLPILHREHFIDNYFKPIYGNLSPDVKLASNYTKMNLDTSPIDPSETYYYEYQKNNLTVLNADMVPLKFQKPLFFLNLIFSISSSINLLHYNPETSNSYKQQAMEFVETIYSSEDRLECLQGLLLLTLYAIMRPSTPGVWYVLGTTLRLCVDLGLHTEKLNDQFSPFIKDLRRRLFWCAYSLDRQICVYLGRPFGIPEESISTKFPVDLDDCLINANETQDFICPTNSLPTYKTISINFFKIRRIQAEILEVLYFTSSTLPRFYSNLNDWKLKIDNQLEQWFKSIPLKTSRKSNCNFNNEFFKLNYYHTKLLLFGVTPKNSKPNDSTLRIIFESSRGIINSYAEFYKSKTINYTWAAVHNLFMAGTSFFYSIYNSPDDLIDLSEFERINRIVIEVLNSLVESCDAASPCVEIFEILSLAMIRLKFENKESRKMYPPNDNIASSDLDDIERFFQQLNEKTPSDFGAGPNLNYQSVTASGQTPEDRYNDGHYPSLSTPPVGSSTSSNGSKSLDVEQQKIFDLMNQVSSDAIWEQFLGSGNFTG